MRIVTREDVVKIAQGVATEVDWKNIDYKESLSEQGVDSLDMINIIFAFQETYEVAISDESISQGEWLTIDGMAENLNKLFPCKE